MSVEDRPFQLHDVHWTRAKSARFWDHTATRPEIQDGYFSRLVGDTIVKIVARTVPLRGRVLDFGSGPGYLLESLMRAGVPCEGADFSEEAVMALRKRLDTAPRFRGATHIDELPSALPSQAFDIVTFIETIEHLLDTDLESTVAELHRILKPNGTLVITTPNDEDLGRSKVLCPDCGGKFHVMQHVRHWSDNSLTEYLGTRGFRRITTRKLALRPTRLGTLAFSVATRLARRKPPNLIWIGSRS